MTLLLLYFIICLLIKKSHDFERHVINKEDFYQKFFLEIFQCFHNLISIGVWRNVRILRNYL